MHLIYQTQVARGEVAASQIWSNIGYYGTASAGV